MSRRSPSTKWKVTTKEPRFPLPLLLLLLLLSMLLSQCSQPSNFSVMDGTLRVESPLTQRAALLSPSRGGCSLHGCFVARLWAAAGPILPHITHPSPTVGRAPQGRGGGVSGQKSNAQKSMLRSCWCQKAEKEAAAPEPLPEHMDPPSEPVLMMAFLHQKCTRLFFSLFCSKSWLSAKLMTVCQLATLFIVY